MSMTLVWGLSYPLAKSGGDETLGEGNGGGLCLYGRQNGCKLQIPNFHHKLKEVTYPWRQRCCQYIRNLLFYKYYQRKYILGLYVFILFHKTDPSVLPTIKRVIINITIQITWNEHLCIRDRAGKFRDDTWFKSQGLESLPKGLQSRMMCSPFTN